jgi:hypothetical protein
VDTDVLEIETARRRIVDLNRDNPRRSVRLSFVNG